MHGVKVEDNNRHRKIFDTEAVRGDLKKKSLRGGLYTVIGQSMSFVIRLGSTAVLARIIIPEHFGLLSMVTALTAVAEQFKDLGLSTATVQKKDVTHEQVSTLFWINGFIGALIMAMICCGSKLIASFYGDDRLIWITIGISTSFFWGGLTVQHQAILFRKMQFSRSTAVEIGASFLSTIIAIVLAFKGYGYWALVWGLMSRSFFSALGTWIVCPWLPGLPSRNANIGEMIKFGRDLSGFNLIVFFTDNLDQILIGKMFGPRPLGFFRQAHSLALFPIGYLTYPVNSVLQPALSILQNDALRYKRYYTKILKSLSFVNMPLMMFLFLEGKDIILFVLGEKWIEAVVIFRIFTLAGFIRPVLNTAGIVMISLGKTKKNFVLGLVNSIAIILAISIGAKWGAVGVAAGHVIENYLMVFPFLYFAFKDSPIDMELFISSILPSIISSLVMAVVLLIFSNTVSIQNHFYGLVASLAIAIVVYLLTWTTMPGGRLKLEELFSDFVLMFKKGERGQVVRLS